MSDPFSELSEENHAQILKYLKFFRQKRDGVIRAATNEFNEIKTDRLGSSQMFSKEDVEDFTDALLSTIRVRLYHVIQLLYQTYVHVFTDILMCKYRIK